MACIEEIELLLPDFLRSLGTFSELLKQLIFADSLFKILLMDSHLFPEVLIYFIFLLNKYFSVSLGSSVLLLDCTI